MENAIEERVRYRVEAEARFKILRPEFGPDAYENKYVRKSFPYGKTAPRKRSAEEARDVAHCWLMRHGRGAVEWSIATMNGGSGIVQSVPVRT